MFDTLNSKVPVCFGKLDATEVLAVLFKKRNRWIAILAVVVIPGFHEAFALEMAKIPSELKDSGFVSMELLLKDGERVFLPISQLGKSVGEGGIDTISGVQKASAPFAPQSKPMGDKPRETNASSTKKPEVAIAEIDAEDVHPSIWIFAAIIVASIIFTNDTKPSRHRFHTPNAHIAGRAIARSGDRRERS